MKSEKMLGYVFSFPYNAKVESLITLQTFTYNAKLRFYSAI